MLCMVVQVAVKAPPIHTVQEKAWHLPKTNSLVGVTTSRVIQYVRRSLRKLSSALMRFHGSTGIFDRAVVKRSQNARYVANILLHIYTELMSEKILHKVF